MRVLILTLLACAALNTPAMAQTGARAELTFSMTIPERDAQDWRDLAEANIASGKPDNVAYAYRKVLELAPGDAEALRYLQRNADDAPDAAPARRDGASPSQPR